MKKVKLHLNYAGYCYAKENDAIRGGRKQKIVFNALWGLIEHPEKGWILYDTGYTNRFFDATKRYPNKIYAKMTKVYIDPKDEVIAQLKENGISPSEIKHIIITHFHGDHVAGLRDFPDATFYTSKTALKQALRVPRAIAFSKGILKDLHPDDLEERTMLIEDVAKKTDDPILGTTYDLFGDDSLKIIPLPGHAAGQIGVLLETEKIQYLLAADSVWLRRSYQELVLPNPIVRLFFHSWLDFKSSLKRVHDYHIANPETVIVPTHCAESTDPLVSREINLDEL
jgi:glyoxylase-like metal-dependent hydrolase (beta-lactamase superfamily II)